MNNRLFIVDHMCVLPYGHNLGSVRLFSTLFQERGWKTICLVSRNLSGFVDQSYGVEKELFFPYGGHFDIKERSGFFSIRFPALMSLINKVIRRISFIIISTFQKVDPVRRNVLIDWERIFQKYSINKNDIIFFPSADYYGCLALLDHLSKIPSIKRPKIHMRMIGVMEYANYSMMKGKFSFFFELKKFLSEGINIKLSAETPTYSRFINKILNIPVPYMPYPLIHSIDPLRWECPKIITSPGQGRVDKGFFKIYSIIKEIFHKGHGKEFCFDIQDMRSSDLDFNRAYQQLLQKIPCLTLRKDILEYDEINSMYRESDILLLPYDLKTYEMRGSAVYQEGIAFGRPVVSTRGTGIAELIDRYQNGLLADNEHEFAQRIIELSEKSKAEIQEITKKARELYLLDVEKGLLDIMTGLDYD